MDSPFTINVYDRNFVQTGSVRIPHEVTLAVRRNALSVLDLTVRGDDLTREALSADGAMITVGFRGEEIFSGRITGASGGFTANDLVAFHADSWWSWMSGTLAWVAPWNPITPSVYTLKPDLFTSYSRTPTIYEQGAYLGQSVVDPAFRVSSFGLGDMRGHTDHYFWPDGSTRGGGYVVRYAEQAIKLVCGQNFARLQRPVRVVGLSEGAPAIVQAKGGLTRGGDARAAGMLPDIRFGTLESELAALIDWSGLTITFTHGTQSKVEMDVRISSECPLLITPESGIIQEGKWFTASPTATRAVVGGPGEMAARAFWEVIKAGLRDDPVEVFREATGWTFVYPEDYPEEHPKNDPDYYALNYQLGERVPKYYRVNENVERSNAKDILAFTNYLTSEGNKAIDAGAGKSGLSIRLAETDTFQFAGPNGVHLGDRITVRTDTGDDFSDIITGVDITFDGDNGLQVEPLTGALEADPFGQVSRAIKSLQLGQQRQGTQK